MSRGREQSAEVDPQRPLRPHATHQGIVKRAAPSLGPQQPELARLMDKVLGILLWPKRADVRRRHLVVPPLAGAEGNGGIGGGELEGRALHVVGSTRGEGGGGVGIRR